MIRFDEAENLSKRDAVVWGEKSIVDEGLFETGAHVAVVKLGFQNKNVVYVWGKFLRHVVAEINDPLLNIVNAVVGFEKNRREKGTKGGIDVVNK